MQADAGVEGGERIFQRPDRAGRALPTSDRCANLRTLAPDALVVDVGTLAYLP